MAEARNPALEQRLVDYTDHPLYLRDKNRYQNKKNGSLSEAEKEGLNEERKKLPVLNKIRFDPSSEWKMSIALDGSYFAWLAVCDESLQETLSQARRIAESLFLTRRQILGRFLIGRVLSEEELKALTQFEHDVPSYRRGLVTEQSPKPQFLVFLPHVTWYTSEALTNFGYPYFGRSWLHASSNELWTVKRLPNPDKKLDLLSFLDIRKIMDEIIREENQVQKKQEKAEKKYTAQRTNQVLVSGHFLVEEENRKAGSCGESDYDDFDDEAHEKIFIKLFKNFLEKNHKLPHALCDRFPEEDGLFMSDFPKTAAELSQYVSQAGQRFQALSQYCDLAFVKMDPNALYQLSQYMYYVSTVFLPNVEPYVKEYHVLISGQSTDNIFFRLNVVFNDDQVDFVSKHPAVLSYTEPCPEEKVGRYLVFEKDKSMACCYYRAFNDVELDSKATPEEWEVEIEKVKIKIKKALDESSKHFFVVGNMLKTIFLVKKEAIDYDAGAYGNAMLAILEKKGLTKADFFNMQNQAVSVDRRGGTAYVQEFLRRMTEKGITKEMLDKEMTDRGVTSQATRGKGDSKAAVSNLSSIRSSEVRSVASAASIAADAQDRRVEQSLRLHFCQNSENEHICNGACASHAAKAKEVASSSFRK